MDAVAKLNHLTERIDEKAGDSHERLRDYRRKAFWLKTSAVVMAATITVLLGLDGLGELSTTAKNIALVLGAVVTVLSAWNAFFDYRSLWITNAVSLFSFRQLRLGVDYYKAGREESEIAIADVDRFAREFDQLVQSDHRRWVNLRSSGQETANAVPDDQSDRAADGSDPEA